MPTYKEGMSLKAVILAGGFGRRLGEKYKDIPEFCYSATKKEIGEKGYNLVPSRYIEFVNRDETADFDTTMKSIQSELTDLLKQEEASKQELLNVFKDLGYEINL